MAAPVIIVPQENWATLVAPTLSTGAIATNHTPAMIADGSPGSQMLTTSLQIELRWDLLAAKQVDYLTHHHHNLDPGHTGIRFRGSTTSGHTGNVWNLTPVIPAKDTDGFSVDSQVNLVTAIPVAGDRTARYVSWLLGTTNNSANISIGELTFGKSRSLPREFSRFVGEAIEYFGKKHKTNGGSTLSYSRGTKLRRFTGEFVVHDSEFQAVKDIWDYLHGAFKPFTLIPNPVHNIAYFGFAIEPILDLGRVGPRTRKLVLRFEEQGRGLVP